MKVLCAVLVGLGLVSGCGTMIANQVAKGMSPVRVEGTDGGAIFGFDVRAAVDHPIVTTVGGLADVATYGGVYLLAKELNKDEQPKQPTYVYHVSGDLVQQTSGGDSSYNRDSQNTAGQ